MLTVIVPIHNAEKFLPKCLDSILSQTYRDLEVIAVDDGSTDDSGLLAYACTLKDKRVTMVRKPNGGVSSARNAGLALAHGDFLTFVDADDWIEPEMYGTMLGEMADDADMVMCGIAVEAGGQAQTLGTDASPLAISGREALALMVRRTELPVEVLHSVANRLYRTGAIAGLRFDEGLCAGEDVDFNAKALPRCRRVRYLPRPLYHYVAHGDNAVNDLALPRRMTYLAAYRRLEAQLRASQPELLPDLHRNLARTLMSFVLLNAADPGEDGLFRPQNPETFWALRREIDACPGFAGELNDTERTVYQWLKDRYEEQEKGSETKPCN